MPFQMVQVGRDVTAGGAEPASWLESGGGSSADGPATPGLWVPGLSTVRLSRIPSDLLLDGGPHSWGFLALLGWLLWLASQAPWSALRAGPHIAHAPGAAPPPRRRGALGAGAGPWLPAVLRTFCYGYTSALLWLAYLEPHREFKSWEDVYFFCGERYQHCTAGFRWDGSGWLQALVVWNFVLSSALLLQKFVIALGLGGLLPGEEVVTRESFVSIAWRLVPYWMNQWEQQWGAECSSMLFELPHFALELLVVLPCVQILCGRLRVMAQPHIREPLPAAAGPAGLGADVDPAGCWVPDVMRCRWRLDPSQRRLLPRLRANLRAMAMLALILAVASSNSLLVPLALEDWPASSQRADQILRFKKELAFVVTTGRHADTALWYQRVAAAAASHEGASAGGETPWAANTSDSAGNGSSGGGAGATARGSAEEESGGIGSREGGSEGAASFLAAALEGSTNSSRLDAKLAVWSTLWRPLLPAHWLRAVMAADAGKVAGLDPAYLSALQFEEHPQSAALASQLHAAANDPAAAAAAAKALQQLLRHPEQAGSILPAAGSAAEREAGREKSMVHLLLMASLAAGIDAKAAPLQLRASAVLAAQPAPQGATAGQDAALAAAQRDISWLRRQQALFAAKLVPQAGREEGSSGGGGSNGSTGARWAAGGLTLTWQAQQRMAPLYRLLHKHCAELERMRSPDHRRLIPLVEASLAIMRLSCERFFSLLAVFLGFLLFRDPPPAAQRVIRVVAAFAAVFQRLVLYSFPAICWAYGAGALFSSFVSVVFWTGPLVRAVERVRNAATSVQPRHWRSATSAEVERMGGQCAICWGDMPAAGSGAASAPPPATGAAAAAAGAANTAAAAPLAPGQPAGVSSGPDGGSSGAGGGAGGAAMSLPCGHAFHRECLQQWLQQCYGQARAATCPMCQASIPLRVRYRMPWHQQAHQAQQEEAAGPGAGADGIPGLAALALVLQEDFRARFEPMLDVGAPLAPPALGALPADAAQWPRPDDILPPPLPQQQQQQQPPHAPPPQQPRPAAAPPQAHPLADAGQQEAAGEGQQGPQHGEQAEQQQPLHQQDLRPPQQPPAGQPELLAPGAAAVAAQQAQQAARRRGLLVRLLNRRRG